MNIDRIMLFSYDIFNFCCAKHKKTVFFVMNFILKKGSKSQVHDNMDENLIYVQFVCHLTTLPNDMYIHLNTIGFTGVTELGTVTF